MEEKRKAKKLVFIAKEAKNSGRGIKLLKWILEQIPQTEHEMKLEEEAANNENGRTAKQRGVKRSRDDGLNEGHSSKRVRSDGGVPDDGSQDCSCRPHGGHSLQHLTIEGSCTMADTSSANSALTPMSATWDPEASKRESGSPLSTGQSSPKQTKSTAPKIHTDNTWTKERKGRVTVRETAGSRITSYPLRRSTRIRKAPERYQ
ncbi:hypothetical protein ACMFMG_001343 [Clarireedia jacksonii]